MTSLGDEIEDIKELESWFFQNRPTQRIFDLRLVKRSHKKCLASEHLRTLFVMDWSSRLIQVKLRENWCKFKNTKFGFGIIMNLIKAFKKWLLNILVPYIEGMPYLVGTNNRKKDLSKEQRFRDLFEKRKTFLIIGVLVLCLMVFGLSKTFSFFIGLIACSPFVVIFWSSFGEQFMGISKFKKNKK